MSEKTAQDLRQLLIGLPVQPDVKKMQTWIEKDLNGGYYSLGLSLEEALEKFHPVDLSRLRHNSDHHYLVYDYTESKTEYTHAVWRSAENEYNYFYTYEFLD